MAGLPTGSCISLKTTITTSKRSLLLNHGMCLDTIPLLCSATLQKLSRICSFKIRGRLVYALGMNMDVRLFYKIFIPQVSLC